jgi:hypothetical protein
MPDNCPPWPLRPRSEESGMSNARAGVRTRISTVDVGRWAVPSSLAGSTTSVNADDLPNREAADDQG